MHAMTAARQAWFNVELGVRWYILDIETIFDPKDFCDLIIAITDAELRCRTAAVCAQMHFAHRRAFVWRRESLSGERQNRSNNGKHAHTEKSIHAHEALYRDERLPLAPCSPTGIDGGSGDIWSFFFFQLEATVPHRGSLANSLPHTATDHFRSGPYIRTEERRWLPFRRLEFDRVPSSAHSMAV